LGTKEKVYARKCTIDKLTHSDIKDFYNEHHIQGAGGTSPHHYALTYGGKIVAAMSFKKPGVRGAAAKNIKDGQWELDRYATAIQVPGGASKLLSHFVNTTKPQSIVSYSDNMLFTGGMYEALGFTNVGVSPPDYKLFFPKETRLRHKSAMQRKHIEAIRQKLDPNNRVPAFDADKSKDPRTGSSGCGGQASPSGRNSTLPLTQNLQYNITHYLPTKEPSWLSYPLEKNQQLRQRRLRPRRCQPRSAN
jgi:hypothetical protein